MLIKLGMIGGGMMGEALLSRLVMQGGVAPETIVVSDPVAQRRDFLAQTYQVQVTPDNQVAAIAEIILLAIKPQLFNAVSVELSAHIPATSLVLSILAGTTIAQLEAAFPGRAIVRAMPNTPAAIGAGMTAIAAGQQTSAQQLEQAERILQTVGQVVTVTESMMDAVTGLSGSGPGYLALVIEAMADGGVAAGLPRAMALQLALQTMRGTAQLLQESGWHPGELKDRVTSPGGTTIAGIRQLEQAGVRSALMEAVLAAYRRSCELGQPPPPDR